MTDRLERRQALRRQAEASLQDRRGNQVPDPAVPSLQEVQRTVHELRVHQIELEMQNEHLRKLHLEVDASRSRYLDLYESAPVGYVTLSSAGMVQQVNRATERLLGQQRSAMVGRSFSRFLCNEDQDGFYMLRKQADMASEPQSLELRLLRDDGTLFWAHLAGSLAMDEDGNAVLRLALGDITARKSAEEGLRKLSRITEQAPVSIVITNLAGNIEYVNPYFTELTGYTPDEVRGANPRMFQTGVTPPATYQSLWQALSAGRVWRGEFYNRKKNGEIFLYLSVIAPVLDAQGSVTHYVALQEDTTEKSRLEHNRLSQLRRIEDLSRRLVQTQEAARRRFSGELHDRTSPNLAALRINLDIIVKADAQSRTTQSYADRIDDTRALIEDTTMSIREICAELHPPALDRGGLLSVVQGYVLQFAKRTGIVVSVHCRHEEMRLHSDLELCLFRVVQEALTNCAKHAQATAVEVWLQLDEGPLQLSVADDGCGFDWAQMDGVRHAMGLGLRNMRETVEFAGGQFRLESEPGRGTRIFVEV